MSYFRCLESLFWGELFPVLGRFFVWVSCVQCLEECWHGISFCSSLRSKLQTFSLHQLNLKRHFCNAGGVCRPRYGVFAADMQCVQAVQAAMAHLEVRKSNSLSNVHIIEQLSSQNIFLMF